jgi:diguanylate cyclase (GGDEF)-like protein
MLRQSDIRCRLGGDEFLVMLPDTAHADALSVGDAVRQAIEQLSVPSIRGMVKVTASIGVATTSPAGDLDAATIIDRADQALYRAKQAGRNRVASSNGMPAVFHNPRPWLVQARPA